jgi:hypothetical protein
MGNDVNIRFTAEDQATETVRRITASFDRLSAVVGPAATAFGAAGAVFAGSGLVSGIRATISALDDLAEAAEGVGTSAVALAEMRQAAKFSGVETEKLDKALGGLASRMADASKGGQESAALFKALGISVKDSQGNLRDGSEVLGDIANKFKGYRDGAEKTALANQIFGEKLGRVLIPYLNQGSEGLRQFAGVSEKSVEDAKKLQDQIDKLSSSWQKLKFQVAGAVAGLFNQDTQSAEALTKQLTDLDKQIERAKASRARERDTERIGAWDVALEGLEDQARRTRAALDAVLAPKNDGDKPPAPVVDTSGKGNTKAQAVQITEAQRALASYVETQRRALEQVQDLSESEKTIAAIRSGMFGEVVPQVRQMLMMNAERIDSTKALAKIEAEAAKQAVKDNEERARAAQAVLDADRARQAELNAAGIQRFEAVRKAFATDEQIEQDRYRKRQEDLQVALMAQRITEDEYRAYNEAAAAEHEQRLTDIKRKQEAERFAVARSTLSLVEGLMNSNSRKMFEIGKAASIANAVISTYEGVMNVWSKWAAYPPLAAALSAVTIATGVANVQRIKSTSFGGGSVGGGSVAAGNVITPGQGPFNTGGTLQLEGPNQASRQAVSLTIVGEVFNAAQVRELIAKINEQSDLGAEIRVTRG